MGIRGRDGLALEDYWADGPKTFLGIQTAGFPNLFFPGGPHAAAGNNPRYNGDQVDFITDTLVYLRDHGYDTIEVDPAAEERVDRPWSTPGAATSPFGESSYFFGTNIPGKPRKYLLNSGGRPKLFKEIAEVVENDYKAFRLSRSSDPGRHRLRTDRRVPVRRWPPASAASPRCRAAAAGRREQEPAPVVLAQPRCQLVQVPHLAEGDAQPEQAEVVDREERVPALRRGPGRPALRRRSCPPPAPRSASR